MIGKNETAKDWKAAACKIYPYRIELHAHTSPASVCSEISPEEMVATYKALDYDAIVLTNHFLTSEEKKEDYIRRYLEDYYRTAALGKEAGLKVYLGTEIRFAENSNDYLIFGVNEKMLGEIYDYLPGGVEAFRKNYPMPNSVFVHAHPMRNSAQVIDPVLLDGVEVFNMHPGHNSRIGLAALYANENKVPIITAGSDFHHPNLNHEGLSALRTATLPEDSFGLAKLLQRQDYVLELGRGTIILP